MYDNFEAGAANKGRSSQIIKTSGFRFKIFYVFINVGGLIARSLLSLRQWWLDYKRLSYVQLYLCHENYINNAANETEALANTTTYDCQRWSYQRYDSFLSPIPANFQYSLLIHCLYCSHAYFSCNFLYKNIPEPDRKPQHDVTYTEEKLLY